jgi:hypothetical protein
MHYRMKHCKQTDAPMVSKPSYACDPCMSEPLPHKAYASDHRVTEMNSRTWNAFCKHVNEDIANKDNDGDSMISDKHSADSIDDARKRERTLYLLRFIAAGACDEAYATIMENASDLIIGAIREVQRAYIAGDLKYLTQAESLVLSRYRKYIEQSAECKSVEQCQEVLLKPPRNSQSSIPRSFEYVPLLLALAVDRDGLETHIANADTACFIGDEDESSSVDDDTEQSSQSDEKDEVDAQEGSDEEVETESVEEDEEGDDEDTEAESGEDEEGDEDTEAESGEDEGEEGDDEDAEAESEEVDDEAEADEESQADEDERHTTKSRKRRHSEESEDSEDSEPDESSGDESEDSGDSESDESGEDEDEESEEGKDVEQPVAEPDAKRKRWTNYMATGVLEH